MNPKKKLLSINVFIHIFSVVVPLLINTLFADTIEPALKQYKTGAASWSQYLWEALTVKPVLGLTLGWLLIFLGAVMLDLMFLRRGEPIAKRLLCWLPLALVLFALSVWFFLIYLPCRP